MFNKRIFLKGIASLFVYPVIKLIPKTKPSELQQPIVHGDRETQIKMTLEIWSYLGEIHSPQKSFPRQYWDIYLRKHL